MKAKRRRWPWGTYTAAEWEAIERAAQQAPQKGPLTEEEMGWLFFAVTLYQIGTRSPDFWEVLCRWDRMDCQLWRKVATHLAEAEKHLEVIKEESDLTNHVARDVLASVNSLREKAEGLATCAAHTHTYFFDDIVKNNLRGALPTKLGKLTTRNSNDPRVIFYEKIAILWERRGGKLTTTWNNYAKERSDQVSGLFVDFFEAVARPVMGSAMPSRHTVRDIVRTQKRRREALRRYAALREGQGDDSAQSE